MIYQTLNHQIDEQALTITDGQHQPLNIRPKTCQLLLLLLKNAGQAVSKQTLLEQVWSDAVVTEQVIFQSINEIRQLFAGTEVIKTIPRQGYLWLPEVTVKENAKKSPLPFKTAALVCCLVVVVLFGWFFTGARQTEEVPDSSALMPLDISKAKGSIVILPTQNLIDGNDHSWVRLGMMDQLIQRLPNTSDYLVLQTDYVLEVLKRADAPYDNIQPEHIKQVFTVSGAEFIVASKLLGGAHDYRLQFEFYYRNMSKKGVLFDKDIQSLIDQFSLVIGKHLGDNSVDIATGYLSDFNNEMLGNAIELSHKRQYQAAVALLQSIVLSHPQNLTAQRLLIDNLFYSRALDKIPGRLKTVLPLARRMQDEDELTRLLFQKALYESVTGGFLEAQSVSDEALNIAEQNQDWLYMAYIKNLQAQLAIENSDYALAERLYTESKQHQQVLRCPAGEIVAWSYLAKLARVQNQTEKFEHALLQAKTIAENRDLGDLFENLNDK